MMKLWHQFLFLLTCVVFSINIIAGTPDSLLLLHKTPDFFSFVDNPSKIGWEVSGNFGVYQPNKHQAKFYNGAPENPNNLNYIFSNFYWRQEIKEQLIMHVQRDSFQIDQLPADISYDATMYVGFSARYNFSEEIALNISFNYSKLQVRDQITLEVFPALSGMVKSYVYCGIFGIEGRTNIDVGGMYTWSPEKPLTPFAEMGLHANSTHVKKHILKVYDREFNMVNIYMNSNYVPGAPVNEYDIRQGGLGFGTYVSGGLRYQMSNHFSMELAGIVYLKTVNLEGYNKKFGLHGGLLLRLVMSPFFEFSSADEIKTPAR